MSSHTLSLKLAEARERRRSIRALTNAWRWWDVDADGLGATVEYFDGYCVLNAYTQSVVAQSQLWGQTLGALGARGVYLKRRVREDVRRLPTNVLAPSLPIWGEAAAENWCVEEFGARFEVQLNAGLSTGLFLDQRDNRQRVRAAARGKSVLNLFAYTCSFSVCAALGGARQVTSVDLSGAVLRRGSRNLELNSLQPDKHRLLRADCVKWVERATRRAERYDIVVVDPPSFGSDGKGTWSVARDYFAFVERCLQLVAERGTLLCVTNHRQTSGDELETALRLAAAKAGRGIAHLEQPPPACDCPAPAGGQSATKSVLLTLS